MDPQKVPSGPRNFAVGHIHIFTNTNRTHVNEGELIGPSSMKFYMHQRGERQTKQMATRIISRYVHVDRQSVSRLE